MRLLVIGLLIVLWATNLFALTPQKVWTRTYGGPAPDYGSSVQQTSDGGYIVAGTEGYDGPDSVQVYLIKTDAAGDTVWTRKYGGTRREAGESVRQTSDGGYIIAGLTTSFGAGQEDVYLIKTNASGDTIWTKTYGGTGSDYGRSVKQTSDGGYIITGFTDSFGAGSYDVYLIKTNASGDTVWTKTYGGASEESGSCVQQTSDGGYVISGYTFSFGAGPTDVYLIRADAGGGVVWGRVYGGASWEFGNSVQQTSDGGYIVAGETESFGAGDSDTYLIRTDADGDTVWTRTYGGTGHEAGFSVQETSDGGYIIAGHTYTFGAGGGDVYLIRADAGGGVIWARAYGDTAEEGSYSVQQTSDGGYIVAGHADPSGTGNDDVYLIRVREHNWKAKDKKFGEPPTPGPGNRDPVVALSNGVPARLALRGSAPNPFSRGTVIRFDLPEQGEVTLSIHDVGGRLLRELVGEVRPPGSHSVAWDGRNSSGRAVQAGIYFVRLESGGKVATGKLVVAH
jgi:hypothetical protein